MSMWTYVNGVITVRPMGRTQPEARYVLDTVIEHLPKVTGSEEDMNVYVIQKNGHDMASTHDEFGQLSNLGNSTRGRGRKMFEIQSQYMIVVDGAFRDRLFPVTLKEFTKWLCRLAKRIRVADILVSVEGYDEKFLFDGECEWLKDMYEWPSWCDGATEKGNWAEYLMWDYDTETSE